MEKPTQVGGGGGAQKDILFHFTLNAIIGSHIVLLIIFYLLNFWYSNIKLSPKIF